MLEGKKGLWYNIRQRRKKGLPRKKPGQKGYPKTLDIGESLLRAYIRESNEMFAGKDLEAMRRTEVANTLEAALLDLQDAGCSESEKAHNAVSDVLGFIMNFDLGHQTTSSHEIWYRLEDAAAAVRECPAIDQAAADAIAGSIEDAITSYQEIDQ